MLEPTIDQATRLAIIREICKREGHGPLIDITTFQEPPMQRSMCNRGCGTEIYTIRRGHFLDVVVLRAFLDKQAGHPMRIKAFEVEIGPAGDADA